MLKYVVLALAMVGLAVVPQGRAAIVGFDPAGGMSYDQLSSLDIAPGNLLVTAESVDDYVVGGITQAYFQASISSYRDETNTLVSLVSAGSEFTVVLGYRQVFTDVTLQTGGRVTSETSLIAGGANYLAVYHDTTAATFADDLAGSGFADGTLVLEGSISDLFSSVTFDYSAISPNPFPGAVPQLFDGSGADDYSGFETYPAGGFFSVISELSFVNSDYFSSLSPGAFIQFSIASGEIELNFKETNPSMEFNAAADGSVSVTPDLGSINGTGVDRQFQVDPNATFVVTPEPASVLIWAGMASVVFLGDSRRRRKSSTVC